jgi:SAM-dependent methyltransferase
MQRDSAEEGQLLYHVGDPGSLPRLADGTLCFVQDSRPDGAQSWDTVYDSRQDEGQEGLSDSNFAGDADVLVNKSSSPYFEALGKQVDQLAPTATTLEVGCGFAGLSLSLGRRGIVAYGVDVSVQAVRAARARFSAFGLDPDRLSLADVERLPFADGTFDLLFGKTVFEHFDSPELAAREMFRVTAPGGRVVFDVPNARNAYWTRASERALGHRHKTDFFTIEDFGAYFEASGFRLRHRWGEALFYMTPFIAMQELRRIGGGGEEAAIADVAARKERVLGGASIGSGVLRLADRTFKAASGLLNRSASALGLVTPRTGVLIGVVAEKPVD